NPGGMVNVSRGHLGREDKYPMQKKYMQILLGLWDTHEDAAIVRDKKSGVYLNMYKMHIVNYMGRYFSVHGPLNISRSVQGSLVLYTAGTSANFIENATSYTDGAFIFGNTLQETLAVANKVKSRLVEKGRVPEDFILATQQNPIVGRTEKEAQDKYLELMKLIPNNSIPPPLFFGSA